LLRCVQNGPPVRPWPDEEGAYLNRYVTDPAAAGQSPAHFQRNPPGRGQLAVFPRYSLGPYRSRDGRFARALKNSQLTCGETKGIQETVH